jgi:hypothetical protein
MKKLMGVQLSMVLIKSCSLTVERSKKKSVLENVLIRLQSNLIFIGFSRFSNLEKLILVYQLKE